MKSTVKKGASMKTVKTMLGDSAGCANSMLTKSKGAGPQGNQSGGGGKKRKGY